MTLKPTAASEMNSEVTALKKTDIILIVDDEKSQRDFLSKLLVSHCQVVLAGSVEEAMQEIAHAMPSMVILDYSMPDVNGLEGLQKLREFHPELPVVMLTGYADLELARKALQRGAAEFMIKPVEPADLLLVAARCLENARHTGVLTHPETSNSAEKSAALRRNSASIDLWRTRMSTIPSGNRALITLASGAAIEARVLRLNRQVVQAEVYDPVCLMEAGQPVAKFNVWVGDEAAYEGPATVSNVMVTGLTSICEFTLETPWAESSTFKEELVLDNVSAAAASFLSRRQDKQEISPQFRMAVADVLTFLTDMRDWMDGLEVSMREVRTTGKDEERQLFERLLQEITPELNHAFKAFEEEARKIPERLMGVHAEHTRSSLHPLILNAPFVHRSFTKPLFYPGDYEVMNYLLGEPFEGKSLFVRIFNAWVVRTGAGSAYRHRVDYMQRMLSQEVRRVLDAGQSECRILSLGCGAAPEVQRFIKSDPLSEQASFTLLDFNPVTMKYLEDKLAEAAAESGREVPVQMHEFSVQQALAHGTRFMNQPRLVRSGPLERGSYDLVYCAGLFDYLSERVCLRLDEIFMELVAPGGQVVVSNFTPANPIRGFMDYALDWRLLHRDESAMRALIPQHSEMESAQMVLEPGEVEIFLHLRKVQAAIGRNLRPLEKDAAALALASHS